MKSKDQTWGSENANAKEVEAARDQREGTQSQLKAARLTSVSDFAVTNRWTAASTLGWYRRRGVTSI